MSLDYENENSEVKSISRKKNKAWREERLQLWLSSLGVDIKNLPSKWNARISVPPAVHQWRPHS